MSDPLKSALRAELIRARRITLNLLGKIPTPYFSRSLHPDFRPLRWHLGHIGMFESLWILEKTKGDEAPGHELSGEDEATGEGQPPLPGVDFASFVLSLGTSALYHLGLVGDPETEKPVAKPDLVLVRQTIDTLAMLETKTRGNLDPEEAKLLDGLLYELRMHYVEISK